MTRQIKWATNNAYFWYLWNLQKVYYHKVVKQHKKELNSPDIDLEAVEPSLSSLISRKPVNLQTRYNQK